MRSLSLSLLISIYKGIHAGLEKGLCKLKGLGQIKVFVSSASKIDSQIILIQEFLSFAWLAYLSFVCVGQSYI